jgi:putative transposase
MKDYKAKLVPGGVYHIYNRAIGDELIFKCDENYRYFLKKYREFIQPVGKTLAYCLMPNHFHFIVLINSEEEIFQFTDQKHLNKWLFERSFKVYEQYLSRTISLRFSHLFNSYAQAYNKMYDRKGSLFIRSYNRKRIESDSYMRKVVLYIHSNPVKDGLVKTFQEWNFCSYNQIISSDCSFITPDYTISMFGDLENFIFVHNQTLKGL